MGNWRSGEGNDRRGLTAGAGMVWQSGWIGEWYDMPNYDGRLHYVVCEIPSSSGRRALASLKKKTSLKVDLAFLKTSEKCKSTALWLYKLNLISLLDASIASFWIVVYPI